MRRGTGTICEQQQRARLGHHAGELRNHRLADLVDPVHISITYTAGVSAPRLRHSTSPTSRRPAHRHQSPVGVVCTSRMPRSPLAVRSSASTPPSGSGCGARCLFPSVSIARASRRKRVARWNGSSLVWDSHEAVKTCMASPSSQKADLSGQPALADTRWSDQSDDAALALHRLLQHPRHGSQFPVAADQRRQLPSPQSGVRAGRDELACGDRCIYTLDPHHLRFAERRDGLYEMRGGFAERHSTRRCDRLHPLGHSDLFSDGGVTTADAHFTGDHLTGIQYDAQSRLDSVALLHRD